MQCGRWLSSRKSRASVGRSLTGSQVYVPTEPGVYSVRPKRAKRLSCNDFDAMIRCVILAAGASSRMGRAKAALPLGSGGQTFLSRIVKTMLAAGLQDIAVVSGAHPDATRSACPRDRRVQLVHNPQWHTGQLSSLLTGLDVGAPAPVEAAVVALIDVPLVSAQTVRTLLDAWRESRAPIVRPARGGEHGHPVIFDAAIFDELRRADVNVGAKAVVRAHEAQILNLAIDDAGAYQDIDTPGDYARVLGELAKTAQKGTVP